MAATTLTSVDTALQHLLERANPVAEAESADLHEALGRILAEDLKASYDIPHADNSAVDGYAVRCADLENGDRLPISARIPAGHAPEPLQPGTAARIFTGASVPEGADAVIMQETVSEEEGQAIFTTPVLPGQNIRRRGQDLQKGTIALKQGSRLRPQELGLIASLGIAQTPVWRRLRVAILTTGDELIDPGQPHKPGCIFNTNRITLMAILQRLGCEVVAAQTVPDTHEATVAALTRAARQADLIITSGGVSVGEEDHVRAVLEDKGQLSLWRLAIKPGKPLAFGSIDDVPVIGLPGNPASVLVSSLMLCAPFIRRSQGDSQTVPPATKLPVGFKVDKASVRREYMRARREIVENQLVVSAYPNQSSGMLSSACWADGLAVVPEHSCLNPGDTVDFYSFSDLLG
ncbi:gephyrin-like molybdotransferase Glp [Marinobacter salicampi]|uniref:molybdopterin molybdotransferase MoeA n=1 Tax=Marinobacter salicampi TaxID=435907 RepID=UPI00140CFF2E|nr:gephyrin-like molybdotransferase Glp [Marinobacter salicampi]